MRDHRPELVPAFVAPDHAFSLVAGRVGQEVDQTTARGVQAPMPRHAGGVQVTSTEDDIDRVTGSGQPAIARSSLTRTVRELARGTDLRFEPLGAVALGGLPEWELFEASIG